MENFIDSNKVYLIQIKHSSGGKGATLDGVYAENKVY